MVTYAHSFLLAVLGDAHDHVLECFPSNWERSVNSQPGDLADHTWLRTTDPECISFSDRMGLGRWLTHHVLTACEILNSVFSRGLLSASLTWCLAFAARLPCVGQSSLALTLLMSLQGDLMPTPLVPSRIPSTSLDPCRGAGLVKTGIWSLIDLGSNRCLIAFTSSMKLWLLTSPP